MLALAAGGVTEPDGFVTEGAGVAGGVPHAARAATTAMRRTLRTDDRHPIGISRTGSGLALGAYDPWLEKSVSDEGFSA